MKAAVYRGPRDIRIEERPDPVCGPRDLVVRVLACGICGSDLHGYKLGLWAEDGWVMGHELSAEVVEVGAELQGVAVGERIFPFGRGAATCGECFWCARGQRHLCERREAGEPIGYSAVGGYAEYVPVRDVDPARLVRVPDAISPDAATFVEPVMGAMNWVAVGAPAAGETAVVIGAGVIGLVCMQLLRPLVGRVIVVEPSARRRALAAELGADLVIDPRAEDPLARLVAETRAGRFFFGEGGAAADLVLDCAGRPETLTLALDAVRAGGRVVLVALYEDPVTINPNRIIHKTIQVVSSFARAAERPFGARTAVDLIADGTVRVEPLITHRFPLDRIGEAFEQQLRADEAVKVLIEPGG